MNIELRKRVALVSVEWDVVDLLDCLSDQFELIGFLDSCSANEIGGIRILGADEDWKKIAASDPTLGVVLGIDPPPLRSKLFRHYESALISITSPRAHVSHRAVVGPASLIQQGVTIMPRAHIGVACKLNVNATIHHDVKIGDFSTIAPGAQVLGNVTVGRECYVGAGVIIRQRVRIGDGCTIGAGAVVVKDVPEGSTVVGVPAERYLRSGNG